MRYIDDAVARRVDRNGDGEGGFSGSNSDNFFYLTDVMFSVRAIVDGEGRLHTRLDYTPYGVAMHGFAADVNGDGVLSFTDLVAFNTVYNGGTALRPGATGYDPDADLSGSGSMDSDDSAAFAARYSAYAPGGSNPTFNAGWIDNPGDANGPDNSVGYDGYWFDLAGATEATSSGLYMVRHRVYDPRLGRWLQPDRLGYIDGSNLFNYVKSRPGQLLDPFGTTSGKPCEFFRSTQKKDISKSWAVPVLGLGTPQLGIGLLTTASIGFQFEIEVEQCPICCDHKKGGFNYNAKYTGSGYGSVSIAGGLFVNIDVGRFAATGYLGLQATLFGKAGEFGAAISWDDCGDVTLPAVPWCIGVHVGGELSGGARLDLTWGWWTGSVGAEAFGNATAKFEVCGECTGFDCSLTSFSFGGVTVNAGVRICMGVGCVERHMFTKTFGGVGS